MKHPQTTELDFGVSLPDGAMDNTDHPVEDLSEAELRHVIELAIIKMRNHAKTLRAAIKNSSLAADEIFLYPTKTAQYEQFKREYVEQASGDPNLREYGSRIPRIVRIRKGVEIEYDRILLSSMTESASHLVQVRQTSRPDTNIEDSYFVVTFDFGTGDTKEWPVQEVIIDRNQRHYEIGRPYMPPTVDLILYKPSKRSPKVTDGQPVDYIHQAHQRSVEKRTKYLQSAHDIAVHLSGYGSQSGLSWGNFRMRETFCDMSAIDNDLIYLREADEWGITHLEDVGSEEEKLQTLWDLVDRRFEEQNAYLLERWRRAWKEQGSDLELGNIIGRFAHGFAT